MAEMIHANMFGFICGKKWSMGHTREIELVKM